MATPKKTTAPRTAPAKAPPPSALSVEAPAPSVEAPAPPAPAPQASPRVTAWYATVAPTGALLGVDHFAEVEDRPEHPTGEHRRTYEDGSSMAVFIARSTLSEVHAIAKARLISGC